MRKTGRNPIQVFLLLLFVGSGCTGQPFQGRDSVGAFTDYLDEHIPRLIKQYGVPGVSMVLVHNGKQVWSGAYGYADIAHHRKMSVDAVFRVESISKSLTAWGVMRLVERGLVDLDAPVEQYLGRWKLPESAYSEQKVTLRRLLSHNAGMPLGTLGEGMEFSPQSYLPPLRKTLLHEARLVREPGSGFSYSNAGFNLLELLIEAVSGQDFATYMADEVLTPLGMHRSSFGWNEVLRSAMPVGYDQRGIPVQTYVYPVQASGGLLASAEDIARFVAAGMTGSYFVNHAVLEEETIHQIYTPQVDVPGLFGVVADAYGLGYFIENLSSGQQAVWQGGQGHGWMSHFHAVPESGDGIIILTNSQRSWPLFAQVLKNWAGWGGFDTVKMGRITFGVTVLRVLIGGVLLLSFWQGYRLVQGVRSGKRRWAPLAGKSRNIRLIQITLGMGMLIVLAWSAARPYLIVSSIFPGTADQAGISLFVLALILMLSALLPTVEN